MSEITTLNSREIVSVMFSHLLRLSLMRFEQHSGSSRRLDYAGEKCFLIVCSLSLQDLE